MISSADVDRWFAADVDVVDSTVVESRECLGDEGVPVVGGVFPVDGG